MTEGFDLFGNPVRPGYGMRGRPAYEASEKDRNKIKMLLAFGWSNTRIAAALDISLATFKRYFRAEMKARDEMRDRLLARQIEIAMEQANAGNIAALKELGRLLDASDRKVMLIKVNAAQIHNPAHPPMGKKAAARAAAQRAGQDSDWGDDLIPEVMN